MHKGKITMLGRIMAGSQAVIAHDEAGQAVFVRIITPTSMCLNHFGLLSESGGGHWERSVCHHRAVNAVRWHVRFTTTTWACCACSDDNEHAGLGSSRPPRWTPWTMDQGV